MDYDNKKAATLWMGQVEPYMDDAFLSAAFTEGMERSDNIVREIRFPANKVTGMPLGYAFIEFLDASIAHKVLHRLSGKHIPKSEPAMRFRLSTVGGKPTEFNVWVGDLDPSVTSEMLREHFTKFYKSITTAHVIINRHTGESKEFGFVHFSDETEQQKCMIEQNNTDLNGRRIICRAARQQTHTQSSYGQNAPQQQYSDMMYYNQINQGSWYKHSEGSATPRTANSQFVDEVDDPDAPVEPVLSDDPAQINKDFVAMSGEVYQALENSRWLGMIHPIVKSSENTLLSHFSS